MEEPGGWGWRETRQKINGTENVKEGRKEPFVETSEWNTVCLHPLTAQSACSAQGFPPALPIHPATIRERVLPRVWGYQEEPPTTQWHTWKNREKGNDKASIRNSAWLSVREYSNPFCCDKVCQSSCSDCHIQSQHTKNGSHLTGRWGRLKDIWWTVDCK